MTLEHTLVSPGTLNMELVAERPHALSEQHTHYCPGCTHGVAQRLVAEVLDELGLSSRAIGIAPVGCSCFVSRYLSVDFAEASHGRAPAMATGVKRMLPHSIVFTYQGDGDLAAIGTGEIIHTAVRAENITVIFINNAVYGMTGGQMAPTTLPGQRTTSTPYGRDVETSGLPIHMSEILSAVSGTAYVARRSLHSPAEIRKAKAAIRRAFMVQEAELGFSMVELLSTCPTNWGMTPEEATHWVRDYMIPVYPLGEFKTSPAVEALR